MAAENPITLAKVGVFSLVLAYRLNHDRSDCFITLHSVTTLIYLEVSIHSSICKNQPIHTLMYVDGFDIMVKTRLRSCRMPEEERMYTVEEVAKRLRVNPRTVRGWIASGELVALDVGREYRISQSDLNAFMEKRKTDKRKKE